MTRSRNEWQKHHALRAALLLAASLLGGCKILTIEEDRALREAQGSQFNASRYVDEMWDSRILPALAEKSVSTAELEDALTTGLDRAGEKLARRAGEGSAWTFVIEGDAVVNAVDATSRKGTVDLTLEGLSPGRVARLQIGPVVSGTAIRDALPFVNFNDFTDQLAFASVGSALTQRSLHDLSPQLEKLRPGEGIRFRGVVNLRSSNEPLVITPLSIQTRGAG